MSTLDIIRAWKDPEYRAGLTPDEQALLPAHPAGFIELDDAYLDGVTGGKYPGCTSFDSACHNCPGPNSWCGP